MAKKDQLRVLRTGTVINATSKQQESEVTKALYRVVEYLGKSFGKRISLEHQSEWPLKDIVAELRLVFKDSEFHYHFERSAIRPDGGILFLRGQPKDAHSYPILIVEVKNQGTNTMRIKEGLAKQAKGNAIERLGDWCFSCV